MTDDNIIGENIGTRGAGRPPGAQNKVTRVLKEAILLAAENAGGAGGLVGYLTLQATESPNAFLALLGKVLPLQLQGDPDAPIALTGITVSFRSPADDAGS